MDLDALANVLSGDLLGEDALQALAGLNNKVKFQNIDDTQFDLLFETLAQAFGKKSTPYTAQIEQTAFRAINNAVRRVIRQNTSQVECTAVVLPILFDYVSPAGLCVNGQQPKDASSNAVRVAETLQDLFLARPSLIENALRENGLTHSRAEVRCGSLLLLEAFLKLINGRFKPFTPSVTHALNDNDENVRQYAADLLCSFFGSAPPHAKNDLIRELDRQRVREATKTKLLSAIGIDIKSEESPGASSTPLPQTSAQAPLIHEIVINPSYKLQEIKPEDVTSIASFKAIVESLKPCFKGKETDTNWNHREAAINRLRALVRGNMLDHPGDIAWALRYLAFVIKVGLFSLRTTLCSASLHLVKDCTQLLKSYMDPLIDPYMGYLCEVVSSTKKITSNLAFITACSLVLNTSLNMKLITYTHNFVGDGLINARVAALKWYHIMFVCHSPDIKYLLESTNAVDFVQADLKKGLCDHASPVREASRAVFWLFAACWPSRGETLGSGLDQQGKKQLLRSQPKELLESYDHNFELHVKSKSTPAASTKSRPQSRIAARPSSRPSSRNAGPSKSTSRPPSRASAQTVAKTNSSKKQILTAQAHVPDIIRRISRALNDPKPNDKILAPVPDAIVPREVAHKAIEEAGKLIDSMPEEPVDAPDTIESEAVAQKVDALGAPKAEADLNQAQKEPTHDQSTENLSERAAPMKETAATPDSGKEGFQQSMLVETLIASAREAVTETIQESNESDVPAFDPSKFDKDLKITSANDFKNALKSELDNMPTVNISMEAVAKKTAAKMAPKFDEYIKMYPESKEAIMQAAAVVETSARKAGKKNAAGDDSSPDAESEVDDVPMSDAVKEYTKEMDKDTEGTTSKLSSLEELLDSDDIDTMSMGMNVLSYVLRGKKPPAEAVSSLGTLSIPPPDLIGKALNYLFEQAMDHNPQVKDLLEKYASSDLVAITLSYVGHAVVMYVAVHLLPAEALVLTVQAIQPLLNIGAIIDTLFEIANADDITEAALIALGGVLTGFDKIPMNPLLRQKAKAALEVIYRLGDLTSDVTAFLADWIGFDSDSDDSSDSDDDSDEEKIAEKHARRFEKNMVQRAPSAVAGAVAILALEQSEPDIAASISKLRLELVTEAASTTENQDEEQREQPPKNDGSDSDTDADNDDSSDDTPAKQLEHEKEAIYAEAISSLHPVSISYKPSSQSNKAVKKFKVNNLNLSTGQPEEAEHIEAVFSPAPKSKAGCLDVFETLVQALEKGKTSKKDLIQLISLSAGAANLSKDSEDNTAYTLWSELPHFRDRAARAILVYCVQPEFTEEELSLGLILVRTLLETNAYTTAVDQLRVLECLCAVSSLSDLPTSIQYASLPKTREALLAHHVNADMFIENLINVVTTGQSTGSRLFALRTLRQVVLRTTSYSDELLGVIRNAITDGDAHVRREAYPILLNIHMQSEAAARCITETLTQGQQRLFEYYSSQA